MTLQVSSDPSITGLDGLPYVVSSSTFSYEDWREMSRLAVEAGMSVRGDAPGYVEEALAEV